MTALPEQLLLIRGLTDPERAAIREGAGAAMLQTILRKVNRVLIVELLRTADTLVLNTRRGLVSRLLRISVGALDRSEPGDLMARVTVEALALIS